MSLLGQGAMTMWHDVKPGMAGDHDDWHSHEHIGERIAIPGFRRGRRCRSVAGDAGWFILYEVDDLSVLSSAGYLERLNNPSAWSQKIIPSIAGVNRTLSRVERSHGIGVGGFVSTIRLSGEFDEDLSGLVVAKGITGAHFLRGDATASRIDTKEKSLRDRPDEVACGIVIIEGYDAEAVAKAGDSLAGDGRLVGHYRLNHLIAEADLVA